MSITDKIKMKELKIKTKTLYLCELIYIILPIIIFLFGWTKWYIAVICCLAGAFCYKRMFSDNSLKKQDHNIKIIPIIFIVCCLVLIFVGYLCGWGRWVIQTNDYEKHNAILADLTNRSWPVYYHNGNEHSMLTYYIGQYILPSIIGKIFNSFRITEIVVFVWSVIGIILVFLHLLSSLRIVHPVKQIGILVIMILFSPTSYLTRVIAGLTYAKQFPIIISEFVYISIEAKTCIQYVSNYAQLSWAFPQVIVCWIIILLLIDNKDNIRYYVPLILPAMIYSILSFSGIVIIAIFYALFILLKNRSVVAWFKQILSIENIIFAITVGSVFLSYYWGNVFSVKPDLVKFHFSAVHLAPWVFLVFYITCVLPYPLILVKRYYKNVLFVISSVIIFILPLFCMGVFNDLMLRASIPAFFIIMYCIMDFLNKKIHNISSFKLSAKLKTKQINCDKYKGKTSFNLKKMLKSENICTVFLILLLIIGAICPILNIVDVLGQSPMFQTTKLKTWGTAETFANRDTDNTKNYDKIYNYYTYDLDNSLFHKYIARVQDTDMIKTGDNQ